MLANNGNYFKSVEKTYPIPISLTLIIAAIILSFVDLMFLNDVIGKILDLSSGESMVIAFALGMVGIFIMAHQGVRISHGAEKKRYALGHYALWIFLGLAFVLIRFFSASILQLDGASGDESLVAIMGLSVREVDVVLAPLMMFLYLATGLMVKDGVKHLLLNPEFEAWRDERKKSKSERRSREEKLRLKAEARVAKAQDEAEKTQEARILELAKIRGEQQQSDKSAAIASALNGDYDSALKQYNAKLNEMKEKYRTISSNIDYVKNIDKQEDQFEHKVKPSLLKIVQGSIDTAQNSVALAIRRKTGEDIAGLCEVIDTHNIDRRE